LGSDRINTLGTLLCLEACRAQGVRRFVFAASAAAYGNDPQLPKREDMVPAPLSPYAVQKLAGEHYVRVYADLHGMRTASLRYFNVIGANQDPHGPYAGVVPQFLERLRSGQPPIIYGDGTQTRDFCHVDNVVAANLLAMA